MKTEIRNETGGKKQETNARDDDNDSETGINHPSQMPDANVPNF